jgi:hypothetical protein
MTNKQNQFKPDPFKSVSKEEFIVKDKETEQIKAAPIKKEAKKSETPKIKRLFDVKIECMLPAVLTYKVLAEDAQQAVELIKGKSPNSVSHKLIGRKELILKVYDSGSSMMRLMKKLLG